jgi:hypothetical protein
MSELQYMKIINREYFRGLSTKEKWETIYRIPFPSESIPLPCRSHMDDLFNLRLLIIPDWNYSGVSNSVDATTNAELDVPPLGTNTSVENGAFNTAISTDAGQPPLQQSLYVGFPSGYLTGGSSGHDAIPSNDLRLWSPVDSGRSYTMNPEFAQPITPLVPTPIYPDGGSPSRNYDSMNGMMSG